MLRSRSRGRRLVALLALVLALLAGSASVASASTLDGGDWFTCALKDDGQVACWGAGGDGQLGTGSSTGSLRPLPVASLTRAVDVATGGAHACAVRSNGRVSCWGENASGQLGDGSDLEAPTPVPSDEVDDAVAITAGDKHTCALRRDRTVACWGFDAFGQLGGGDGSGIEDVVSLDAGETATCAVVGSGVISCWGDAQLERAPLIADAAQVSAGARHACAVRRGGTVVCWGANDRGQLGLGTTTQPSRWSDVPGLAGVTAVAAGGDATCAVRRDGTVACWGVGADGQLGDGALSDRTSPAAVAGLSDAIAVTVGGLHACAQRADGSAVCWGENRAGQLGNGVAGRSETPVVALGTSGATAVSSGVGRLRCAIVAGAVKCWGVDVVAGAPAPAPVAVGGLGAATSVAVGNRHACALLSDASIRCWGGNAKGQLGDGTFEDGDTPVTAAGVSARSVAAGYNSSCAVTAGATPHVECWGDRFFRAGPGETYGHWEQIATPQEIDGTDGALEVAVMSYATCARFPDGGVRCWGSNNDAELGMGRKGDAWHSTDPVAVLTGPGTPLGGVVDLEVVDERATCARRGDGTAVCWGLDRGDYATPVAGGLPLPADRCELSGGAVACVGDGTSGQLGDGYQPAGHFQLQPAPAAVAGLTGLRRPAGAPDPGTDPGTDPGRGGGDPPGGDPPGSNPPGGDPPGGNPPGGDPPGGNPPRPAARRFALTRAKPVKGGRIGLTLSLPAAGRVRVVATAKVRGKRVAWFTTRKPLAVAAGRRTVVVVPGAAARRALRKARRAKVSLRVTFTPRGGKAVVRTATVAVRR